MNFVLNHAPGGGSIARPVIQQSQHALKLDVRYLLITKNQYLQIKQELTGLDREPPGIN